MKFAIGYQQPESEESFSCIVRDYREHIAEVYFPWVGIASCRAPLGRARGGVDWNAQYGLEQDLTDIRKMGIKLDLLFNANCYGDRAVSVHFENEIISILRHLNSLDICPDIVTTTSLFVARTVKKHFPEIEVRASVNMRIGSTSAMSYVSGLFDSFYIWRDIQRDVNAVNDLKKWCDEHGKGLHMLANSGCLRCCPGQTFHDNMVAHDAGIDEMKNVPGWTPYVCWNLYKEDVNYAEFLKSSWVRPEDISHYEGIIDVMKLATRQHSHPRVVIGAYVNRSFRGNLLDLCEPSFSPAFAPDIIDNSRFPEDWFGTAASCAVNCNNCGKCGKVLKEVLRRMDG
jgi:collagenase-like PrtC family protease